MKRCNRFFNAGLGLLLLSFFMLAGSRATAQTVSLLSTEDFSSSSLPSGWSSTGSWSTGDNNSWFWSSNGMGGSNGAAMDDFWDYSSDVLSTPSVDASTYTNSSDSVWLDFDFFWEANAYTGYGDDDFGVLANSDVLLQGTESTIPTYSNSSDYTFDAVQTSSSDWVHYHLLIPTNDRTSALTISFALIHISEP